MGIPTVSLVIPCHNDEAWLADAIRSSLDQTVAPIEIIVADDGSTDRSREIASGFGGIVKVLTAPKAGGSAARNRGWRAATGEWLQFLDADDMLDAEKLERHLPRAVKAEPGVATFCASRVVEMGTGRLLHESVHPPGVPELERLYYEPITPCMPLYHRSALERVGGFNESLPNCQDRDLHFRIWLAGVKLEPFADTLVTIRRRPGSVSSNIAAALRNLPKVFEPAISLRDARLATPQARALTARMLTEVGRGLAKAGAWDDCEQFHQMAHKLDARAVARCYGRFTRLLLRLGGPKLANLPQRLRQ